MNNSLEKALKETWRNKEKFYEDTKHLSIMEIIEKIEGKKFEINFGKLQCGSVQDFQFQDLPELTR
jgi:hypothetical protein